MSASVRRSLRWTLLVKDHRRGLSTAVRCRQRHQNPHRHRTSQLFQPTHEAGQAKTKQLKDDQDLSKSSRLLVEAGLVRHAYPGAYTYLPLAMRSLEKLNRLIDDNMRRVGGQKVMMPTMTAVGSWKKTGRLEGAMKGELFKVRDRHGQDYLLSPTHEEAVTDLLANHVGQVSHKNLPLRLYQTTNKFRDEMRPRYGIIRGREFVMKDMYTFDTDITAAMETYQAVNKAYARFFRQLFEKEVVNSSSTTSLGHHNWPLFLRRVSGDTGAIGGTASHEYHILADSIGQDRLMVCNECHRGHNVEVDTRDRLEECPNCQGKQQLIESKGIEVAHTFLLGDKYSSALGARYMGLDNKPHNMFMGCYGIGVSRLMAACLETLSTETELRWPQAIVPFSACVICPKPGSKEASQMLEAHALYDALNTDVFPDDVIMDDRDKVSVGKKRRDAYRTGYTHVILFGKDCVGRDGAEPKVELHVLSGSLSGGEPQVNLIPLKDVKNVISYMKETSFRTSLKDDLHAR